MRDKEDLDIQGRQHLFIQEPMEAGTTIEYPVSEYPRMMFSENIRRRLPKGLYIIQSVRIFNEIDQENLLRQPSIAVLWKGYYPGNQRLLRYDIFRRT